MKKNTIHSGEKPTLVAAGKSSRLDAIRKKALGQNVTNEPAKKTKILNVELGLSLQTKDALEQIDTLCEKKISFILNGYPEGKKNTFFKFKYGVSVDKLKKEVIQDIVKQLNLDIQQIKHYKLVEKLYLNGLEKNAE